MKYLRLAKEVLSEVTISGDEATSLCPFHSDNTPSFRFNVRRGLFYCHSCGARGNADDLLQGQRAMSADLQSNLELLDTQIEGLKAPIQWDATGNRVDPPESSLARYRFPHPYWKSRGLDEDTVDWWDLGYDPISQRLTIPIRDEAGKLLGVIFRRLDNGRPKYLYPRGFSRSRNLFGSWKISRHRTACLVEGSLDAIRVFQAGYPALAIYGSAVSEHQVRLLHRLGITRAICFFDADDAGRKAEGEARDKIRGIELEIVQWPRGWEGRDPGGLPLTAIDKLLDGYF